MSDQRRATVDCRGGVLIVASFSKTTAGFWVMNGRHCVLDSAVSDDELGTAVRRALDHSLPGVPVPDRSTLPIAPLLADLGLKSFGAYLKGARSVGVRADAAITLAPTRNAGARAGFIEVEGAAQVIETTVSASQLGAAVRHSLEASE